MSDWMLSTTWSTAFGGRSEWGLTWYSKQKRSGKTYIQNSKK
jgi:hypothetical protein